MISFLKNEGIAIYTNQELLKEERVKLLEQYIKHLDKPKEFPSPFRFGTNIQKEAAKKLVNQNHFVDRNLVQLFKWHDRFFWKVETEGFKALFDNKNHRLYSLTYKRAQTDLEIIFENYKHDSIGRIFPHLIFIKKSNEQSRLMLTNLRYSGKIQPVATTVESPFIL